MTLASTVVKNAGWVAGFVAVAIWGVTFVSTDALLVDFSASEILLGRLAFAVIALALVKARRPVSISTRDRVAMAAMALLGIVLYQYLENMAIDLTDASNIAIVMSAGPLLTTLMVGRFYGESRPGRTFFLGAGIATIGILSLGVTSRPVLHFIGDVLAILAITSWAAYAVLLTYINAKGFDPVFVMRRICTYAFFLTVPLAAPSAVSGNFARWGTFHNLCNLAFLGIFGSATAFVLWNVSCKWVGTSRATMLTYLTPVVASVFASAFLGDSLTVRKVIGITLVLGGLAVSKIH